MKKISRLAPETQSAVDVLRRTVQYTLSTPAVGRDLHTVPNEAWELDNYKKNPVFLWAHDDQQLPIGRMVDIGVEGGALVGTVEYASADLNPFADTVYQLVRAKFLNAVSTSWQPLQWSFSKDKNRAGGIDFKQVDMLEVSQVPIPALPAALAAARSCGLNVRPMREWAESALARPACRSISRERLEAIVRSASGGRASIQVPRGYDDPGRAGRRARMVRARELQDVGERMERARRLRGGEPDISHISADRAKLTAARRHVGRAVKAHKALLGHREDHGDQIKEVEKTHERMTSTLSELGIRSGGRTKLERHLDVLARCIKAMRSTHEDTEDSLDGQRHSLDEADDAISKVLALGEPTTADLED